MEHLSTGEEKAGRGTNLHDHAVFPSLQVVVISGFSAAVAGKPSDPSIETRRKKAVF